MPPIIVWPSELERDEVHRETITDDTNPHAHGKMSAITQASAQVAKTVAVTTGKVSNAKSMMIWRPHGNKYVETKRARERDEMKMKVGEGLAISREGVIIANARFVEG